MKKTSILLVINLLLLNFYSFAQVPQSFSYQAVVRDAQGNVLQNQNVTFRFSIIENSPTGNTVYSETQSTATNNLGLVVLAIGTGTVQQGTFSNIQWGNAPHFLKVELDVAGGNNFIEMGTTQLLSVPYALHAQTADNVQTYTAGNGISITGNVIENTAPDQIVNITGQGATTITGTYPNFTISSTDNVNDADADPNNEIQMLNLNGNQLSISSGNSVNLPIHNYSFGNGLSNNNDTINSVWTENGYNIYNNNTGRVGIGITAPTGKLTVQGDTSNILFEVKDKNGIPVFVVYQDSVHVFVNTSSAKSNKGCFAVNAKSQNKANPTPYLRVAPDSTRIWTEDTLQGFGVRNRNAGTTNSYMQLTPSNYFIGHEAGKNITTGRYNSFIGFQSGKYTTNGDYNVFLGYNTGLYNTGSDNTFIGYEAGKYHHSTGGNVFLGSKAGRYDTSGTKNIFIGESAGEYNKSGKNNIFIGSMAGYLNEGGSGINGDYNVFIGNIAGKLNTTGFSNIFIGDGSGYNNTSGYQNIYIGRYSQSDTNSFDNVHLGNNTNMKGYGNTLIGDHAGWLGIGNKNVLLGRNAGFRIHQSNKLFIENSSDTLTPLVNGDFLSNRLAINRVADTYPFQVGTNSTNGNGAYLTAGGVWTVISSKILKDRFEELNKNDLLGKIEQLDIKAWYYKGTQERHIGPFAEDFYQAFGTGVLNEPTYLGKSIAPSDVAGVSLAAVKELIKLNKQQSDLINQLMQRIEQLENKLNNSNKPINNPAQNNTN